MTQNLEKLKAKWNKKLKDSGFHDIENLDGSLQAEVDPRTISNALNDGSEEYYSQARDFLNRADKCTLLEYSIWKLHTEGTSFRDIAKEFNITFYKVRTIVIKIQKIAGLRK